MKNSDKITLLEIARLSLNGYSKGKVLDIIDLSDTEAQRLFDEVNHYLEKKEVKRA